MPSTEKEIDLLESIYHASTPPRQRELARAIGLSLGMTNEILKRMARKGWLTIRKVNNRNIQYIVSARGIDEIARRSYRYLRRTIGNVLRYKEAIEELVKSAADRGARVVLLVGQSDLDFILEHACSRAGVELVTVDEGPAPKIDVPEGALVVLSERLQDAGEPGPAPGAVPLWTLLAERRPTDARVG